MVDGSCRGAKVHVMVHGERCAVILRRYGAREKEEKAVMAVAVAVCGAV